MQLNKTALCKEMGSRIQNLRKDYGLTVLELSEMLGMSPGHLGLMERGERGVSSEWLIKMCAIFKCSADYILTGKDYSAVVPVGGSPLAVSIDLLLNDSEKRKLAEFIKLFVGRF